MRDARQRVARLEQAQTARVDYAAMLRARDAARAKVQAWLEQYATRHPAGVPLLSDDTVWHEGLRELKQAIQARGRR